jgi:NAD(P)-dependent dehydrogenase (short-subunit alcohol dehydrogenase family)
MLKNKIALVTGASQGIGKCIAEKLGEAEATLAIVALENEALQKASEEYKARGFRFRVYGVDLSIDSQVESLALSVAKDLGPVDILVNNAGIGGPTAPAHKVDPKDWDKTLQINLRTPFMLSRAIIPSMIARKSGKIINMSSIAGKMAYPLRTPYRGEDGLSFAHTIRVIQVGARGTDTDTRSGTRSLQHSGERHLSWSNENRIDRIGDTRSRRRHGNGL